MTRLVPALILSALFTAIGIVCGYVAGGKAAGEAEPHAPHEADAESHPEHPDEEPHDHAAPVLAPATLRNLGVELGRAELTTYARHVAVPAVIAGTPRTRQAVFAPAAGRIRCVEAELGAVVASGAVVATLVRDPLPRAELVLTRHIIEPASENLHEAIGLYQKAMVALEIHEAELARLEAIAKGEEAAVLPGAQIIQARYDVKRARREVDSLRHKLELHGLQAEQIEAIARGESPPVDVEVCLGALRHNGLWTPLCTEILAALPAELQALSWTVATLGEIVAGGIVDRELADWLRREPAAARHFLEIGGLLQRGHSLEAVRNAFALGALDPVVAVKAPALAEDFDVEAVLVKPGERVAEGQPLLLLNNPRELCLRVEPTGGEIVVVLGALETDAPATARALVPGAAPPLDGLRIQRLVHEESGRPVAYLPVPNAPRVARQDGDGRTFRSWHVGEGQRYMLRIRTEELPRVYVLPAAAVTDDGPDKVIFRRSGNGFTRIAVEILHQDDEVAVIPPTDGLFPGNTIVTAGAFALGLALRSAAGGAAADHGHLH